MGTAELLEAGVAMAEVTRILAERFGCSTRQVQWYIAHAVKVGGSVEIPQEMTVFTVKLPAALAARVGQRARESGGTISALVTQALTEFLARSRKGLRE